MQSQRQWRRIREYEASGNVTAALIACQSLLQSQPDDADAWEFLCSHEARRGHYRASYHAATQMAASVMRTGRVDRLAFATANLLGFDESHIVGQLIGCADWQSPEIARQAPVLAQHLMLAGQDHEAYRFCDAVRPLIRADARIEYVSGLASRNVGDAAAATGAFERAIAINGAFTPPHRSLAYHQPAGLPRVARIEAALSGVRDNADAMADLCYALYRENEHAGRTEIAWTWLARGAAAARAGTRFEEPEGSTWSVDQNPQAAPSPDGGAASLIFVVGLPRSGTTVLERILGNHRRVHAAGELNSFHAALCYEADAFLQPPATTRNFPPGAGTGSGVGDRYRRAAARYARDGQVLVDKNPANFLYAGLIAQALPEARILCLQREAMSVCFSNLRERFEGEAYAYSYSLDSLARHYAWFEHARRTFEKGLPGRFMTVSYEALVRDPLAMAARVLAFCGLEYEEGCEQIERNTAPVSTASSSQVREPVHARSIDAWRRYERFLAPMRRQLCELGVTT